MKAAARASKESIDRSSKERRFTTEIIFGGGGPLMGYQIGIAQAIWEELDHAMMRREVAFRGGSSGSFAALFLMLSVHGHRSPKEWYFSCARPGYELGDLNCFGPLGKLAALVQKTGEDIFTECGGAKVFAEGQVEMDITELPTFTKHSFSVFTSADQLGDALCATSYWPFVMKWAPWHKVNGLRGFDSGFTGWMQPEPYRKSVGFVWVFPLFGLSEGPTSTVFNLHDWMVPGSSKCPWGPSKVFGNTTVGDQLFDLGRKHALSHMREISEALDIPLARAEGNTTVVARQASLDPLDTMFEKKWVDSEKAATKLTTKLTKR